MPHHDAVQYDFDTPPDRRRSHSIKWSRVAGRDVIPMWVADMDFAAPPPVLQALQTQIAMGDMGYAAPWPSLMSAIVDGIARDHDWNIDPDWIVLLPGVVSGFNLACLLAGEPGDTVATLTPVYPPFLSAPHNAGRKLVRSDMVQDGAQGGRWVCDFDDLAARCTSRTRLLMLCNPHNPVGRSFSRAELSQLGEFAVARDMLICSDEIHCGLVLNPNTPHIPLATLSEDIARRTITLMAPSKTWNIPGLSCAFAVIPDAALRRRFQRAAEGLMPHTNVMGLIATEAAYRDAHDWRLALLDYLRGNAELVQRSIASMPGIRTTPVDATYLAWLDCRELPKEKTQNPMAFFEANGVLMSDGRDFGAPGFLRLNFGCSRTLLNEALTRMQHAIAHI
ncbi:PatB family C-S lyase [Uliginosibacterium sp. H3]|uniref:cysteine-S-conjugate beta-lyase n=1 Tax=Uliginosibacterium silvisoli TaxID=3114758 RepID=A0ABU6JXK5_9RHOO|nr:PatB family C-S lyase [Uliginosibacterium sp. H3]